MQQAQFESRSLFDLFGITEPNAKNVFFPVNADPGPMVPPLEESYEFESSQVRRLLIWIGGFAGKNLLIAGPTGCGKSSLLEQFLARLGWEMYRVPCHGKLEFSELTGQLTLLPDGSTKFVHGPLPRAMMNGAVLTLDELNFIHPSVIGALNTVLDGGPLLIPETGELITPHERFRIAATGNAVDHGDDASLYRGTQRMNLALIQRFLTIKADYLPGPQEVAMLHRLLPAMPGKVMGKMVEVAGDVRASFKKGDIDSTVSTRTLVRWAKVLNARLGALVADPEKEIAFALRFVLTDALKPEDAKAIEGVLQRRIAGIQVQLPTPGTVPSKPTRSSRTPGHRSGTSSSAPDQELRTVHFLVNPVPNKNGRRYCWIGVESSVTGSDGAILEGTLHPKVTLGVKADVDLAKIRSMMASMVKNEGFRISAETLVKLGDAEPTAVSVAEALCKAIEAGSAGKTIRCQSKEAQVIAESLALQMGITSSTFVI